MGYGDLGSCPKTRGTRYMISSLPSPLGNLSPKGRLPVEGSSQHCGAFARDTARAGEQKGDGVCLNVYLGSTPGPSPGARAVRRSYQIHLRCCGAHPYSRASFPQATPEHDSRHSGESARTNTCLSFLCCNWSPLPSDPVHKMLHWASQTRPPAG